MHLTAPNGTSFAVSGADALGLDRLPVRFHAHIRSTGNASDFTAQRIVVQDVSAPTPRTCWVGRTYGHWRLLLSCGTDAEHLRIFDLLDGRVNADGFVVFDPKSPMKITGTDSPDVEFGDGAIGIYSAASFPAACPSTEQANASG